MKTLPALLCLALSFTAIAEDVYTSPTVLTEAEARQAEIDMERNRMAIRKHWKDRLATATENEKKLAGFDTPLKKTSATDVAHKP